MSKHNLTKTRKAERILDSLSDRQIDALDRVAQHKTSKEIARELDLHPNTVDQHIRAATRKLGVEGRAEAARQYIELRNLCAQTTCGRTTCDPPAIDVARSKKEKDLQELPREPHFRLEDSEIGFSSTWGPGGSQFLEVFDRRLGRVGRVALVAGSALAIAIIALLVVSIGTTLSEWV